MLLLVGLELMAFVRETLPMEVTVMGHALIHTGLLDAGAEWLGSFLTEVQVTERSELVGTIFLDARLTTRYRATVLAILRDDQRLVANIATNSLEPGDVLIVQAGVDSRPFIIVVCFAASADFMTPMSYQTNLMV